MRNKRSKLESTVAQLYVKSKAVLSLSILSISFFCLITGCGPEETEMKDTASNLDSGQKDSIPPLQVLVPGFSVKEIPLDLNNINVVRYGSDGRLYALAYDGNIYVLSDTDGDGLEDKADYWWDKKPLVSPVGMVVTDEGIYVTCLNKVSLIKDLDNDGIAETEEIITSDWEMPSVYTGTTATGVDAFGIAKDKKGNIFFALGAADFTKPYMVDSLGTSKYNLKSERGTILKVRPGSSEREIFATGTRFPVAMAFNKEEDLFATDQEGATWAPNGNPYDELLHIQEGRHYGFPTRHPKYLPNVIDEPSVYDYKPQHQSTTGLNFNYPVIKGPVFGPEWWSGDAIVTGYSRGKIYRTKLTKTSSGYVAQNNIIVSCTALTVDACVSPEGALVVATHSGPPDWGTGPQGKGKLYKIFYTDPDLPNPVSVWASKPDQVKIEFDKPVNEEYLIDLADKTKIEYGEYVEAGDRFEVVRPGYKAVERQMNFQRASLKVKNAFLSKDGRTIILNTFTHTAPVNYAISLPAFGTAKKTENSVRQNQAIDLSYTLNGVKVSWESKSGEEKWEGVIPHVDLKVCHDLNKQASEEISWEKVLLKQGSVDISTKLDLYHMLWPDIQPESTLDFNYPKEDVFLMFKSSEPLVINSPSTTISKSVKKEGFYETKLTFKDVERKAYDLNISMNTSGKTPVLELYYFTGKDQRHRVLQPHRFFLPWLEDIYPVEMSPVKSVPELAGGNWSRGKELFYGEATCYTCHSKDGKGKSVGPDLSNLIYRDYTSVLRDISDPSATINPDYLGYTVTLKDNTKLTGMISYKQDSIVVRDIADNKTVRSLEDVESTTPLSTSLMPPGWDKVLGEQKMKDLMTYLLTSMQSAKIEFPFPPAMKNLAEVSEVLKAKKSDLKSSKKLLRVLWVSGPKDHGPDEHDYPLQKERWKQLLSMSDNVEVTNVSKWPAPDQFAAADVVVFYWNYPEFNEESGKQLDKFLQRGGGLVYLHYAVDATDNPEALADRIGLAWGGKPKFRHGRVELNFRKDFHPITQGFDKTVFEDETYWDLVKGSKEINVLATASEEGKDIPILWTTTEGKGRVFVSILGHYNWTFDDPLFRILLLRGIAWTGKEPIDRFEPIATMGARISK